MKNKSLKRKQPRPGSFPAPTSKRPSSEFAPKISTSSVPDSAGEVVPTGPNRSVTNPNRSTAAPSGCGRSSAVEIPSGTDGMRAAAAELVISLGNRDPLKAAL